jgi:ABC-type Fe3+-siderophore transport system permease subunit
VTAIAFRLSPSRLAAGLAVSASIACALLLAAPIAELRANPVPRGFYDATRMVLIYATLPRLFMALLCGATLAAAGAILQQALSNPLASPTTLGVDAGARLAIALASMFEPDLFGFGRDAVALAGSIVSTFTVFALVRNRSFSAISIVLSGLVVSLYCGALAAILTLVENRYLTSLFIWGSGSLSQQSWHPSLSLLLRIGISAPPALILLRPLSLLDLGDDTSRGLGLSVGSIRVLAIGVAVLLSAFVTSAVGVIGFVGLAAPILARLAGARRFPQRLAWSCVIGALLLLLTDAALQFVASGSAEFLPTGAVTAVLGSPLLLLLLPGLKLAQPPLLARRVEGAAPERSIGVWIGAAVALLMVLSMALLVGHGMDGSWSVSGPDEWGAVMPWRAPRFVAAIAGGGLLAAAGFILQRLTNNPLASPEVLGVSAGAILAVTLLMFITGSPGLAAQNIAAVLGGVAVLTLILLVARGAGFAPELVLLAGVALSALVDAIVGLITAAGDPRAVALLSWLDGTTSGTSSTMALFALAGCAILGLLAAFAGRWLTILPLGAAAAQALGAPLRRARLALVLLAALMTAVATLVVGPLTFIGLLAPHIVRAASVRRATSGLGASIFMGAALMGIADFFARTIAFPIQLPTGLVATLIAGPFLLLLLTRGAGLSRASWI